MMLWETEQETRKLHARWAKCALTLISLLFTLTILELSFRLFYPQSGYSLAVAPWGWTHRPNSKVTFYKEIPEFHFDLRKRARPISISYNSKGLRELEYPFEKSTGVLRILVLGDSWAEDMGSPFENLVPRRLESELSTAVSAQKVEVINAGHYAFDNAQELMYYLREGRKYSSDLVVVFYSGDTADPSFASLSSQGELLLHYKEFSAAQRIYRYSVSLVRAHSHLGSFLLSRITNFPSLKSFLIRTGWKENDKEISHLNPHRPHHSFSEVDKAIWKTLRRETELENARLVFINCNRPLTENDRAFLIGHRFHLLELDRVPIETVQAIRSSDIANGKYDASLESHRFGYRQNERIARDITKFLIDSQLVPSLEGDQKHARASL